MKIQQLKNGFFIEFNTENGTSRLCNESLGQGTPRINGPWVGYTTPCSLALNERNIYIYMGEYWNGSVDQGLWKKV